MVNNMPNINQMLNMIINNSQAMQNPIFANTVNMYKKGDSKGLEQIAMNLCQTRGISLDEVKKRIGI